MDWLLPIIISLAGGVCWLTLYLKYGREPLVPEPQEPVSDPPEEWTPTQLGMLWNWGELSTHDMIASILDLARRGAIDLIPEPVTDLNVGGLVGMGAGTEYRVARSATFKEDLSPADRYLLDAVLFRSGSDMPVPVRNVMIEGARNWPKAWDVFYDWCNLAAQEGLPFELEDPVSVKKSEVATLVGFLVLFSTYPVVLLTHAFPAFLPLIVGGAMIIGSSTIRRRSEDAMRAYCRWECYRDFLLKGTSVSTQPPEAVAVYGRKLVYGVVLEVAEAAAAPFELLFPSEDTVRESLPLYNR